MHIQTWMCILEFLVAICKENIQFCIKNPNFLWKKAIILHRKMQNLEKTQFSWVFSRLSWKNPIKPSNKTRVFSSRVFSSCQPWTTLLSNYNSPGNHQFPRGKKTNDIQRLTYNAAPGTGGDRSLAKTCWSWWRCLSRNFMRNKICKMSHDASAITY